ncbi:MAG TPA: sodium:proton antiporter [Steroidobacteraceae bacterium]
MQTDTLIILLFSIAAAVAILARQLNLPYTVALVLTGLALGALDLFSPPHLTKELLFTVFLPGLLFEAAFHIRAQEFLHNRWAIASLAVPGVAVAVALTTVILTPVIGLWHLEPSFTWTYALVFGALISATDPIAVVAVFKTLGVPRRLSVMLESESLLNDGTAIVFFTLSLSLLAGTQVALGQVTIDFFEIVGFGALIGLAVGAAVSQVIQRIDDAMIAITLTSIAAYGSFVAAESLHYSGVIAVVVAGVVCGNFAKRGGMSTAGRLAVASFWEYVAFALNSLVFLLIGLSVKLSALLSSWKAILIAYLIVTVSRAVVVFAVSGLLRKSRERVPWQWSLVLTWGGLRGALPMVLVLSLPRELPHWELLVTMTFGVVLISILAQGVTVSPLLRALGIGAAGKEHAAHVLARERLVAAKVALEGLPAAEGGENGGGIRERYEQVCADIQARLRELEFQEEPPQSVNKPVE